MIITKPYKNTKKPIKICRMIIKKPSKCSKTPYKNIKKPIKSCRMVIKKRRKSSKKPSNRKKKLRRNVKKSIN